MESNEKELALYFKNNLGYKRLLKGIKTQYIRFGEIKGNVIINNPESDEKQALSGLMKQDYSKNKSICINLKTLEQKLENTRFSGVDLKQVIYEYFGEEIITQKEKKQNYKTQIELFFEEILNKNIQTKVYKYLQEIINSKNEIYVNLKMYYNKNKQELESALLNACKGINNLPQEKTRIPVFASNITQNPHEFDKNTITGKIFVMLLCYIENIKVPTNSEELLEIYYNNNLMIDDVSNMVLCKNIIGYKKCENGQKAQIKDYTEHKGLSGFAQYNEPIYLNLYNLSNIQCLIKNTQNDKVVVMENPAVFMAVSEKIKNKDFPLVCTYGQVKLSGLVLLDMLVKQNYKIYYSGDIDPEGIQIADKLKSRYNQNLQFFGFDINTYKNNLSNIELSNSRLKKLDKIKNSELQKLCNEVKTIKKASYEEQNIDMLTKFIDNF